ncbi:hypothetical protein BOX15_Mlig016171g1 [Macrostomum lignano]|uniref:Uncharacterized protein n=1 Tax=Macrostomum lignano TaxID=282301 RepID=A0A267ESG9_9PLAT|nr:hypothetical protein BOX15_Mlig016171g1 [Macrostomum lignano]
MFDESQSHSPLKSDPISHESEHQQQQQTASTAAEILETCFGCQTGIADKYLLRIRSLAWHEQCATCCICNSQLTEGCFVRDNRLYCAHDYARRHGIRCQSCGQPIATQDLAMWAHSYAYHLACFVCAACGAQLRKGDQFAVRPSDGRPVCMCDAASVIGGGGGSAGGDCSGGSSSSVVNFCPDERQLTPVRGTAAGPASAGAAVDDSCGRRRARTVLTSGQRRRFRLAFEQNPRPARRVCEALANEAGLAVRVVQVWFQNQRAQLKKRSDGGPPSPRQLRSGGRRGRPTRQQSVSTSQQSSEFAEDYDDDDDNIDEEGAADYDFEEDRGVEGEAPADDGVGGEFEEDFGPDGGKAGGEDEAELGGLMIVPAMESPPY